MVNNTGATVYVGAEVLKNGETKKIPYSDLGNNTANIYISTSAKNIGSISAVITSGNILGVFYNYVDLYWSTISVKSFIAMIYIAGFLSDSTVTITT